MTVRPEFFLYLAVMAGVTYLIRMIPLALLQKRITNRFVLSFLYYVPYAVLSAMVVPAIFTATRSPISAIAGFLVAVVLSYCKKSLIVVALASSVTVFLAEWLLTIL